MWRGGFNCRAANWRRTRPLRRVIAAGVGAQTAPRQQLRRHGFAHVSRIYTGEGAMERGVLCRGRAMLCRCERTADGAARDG